MKIEVNLNKKYSLIGALIAVVLIFGIVNVIAYTKSVGTVPNPGHELKSIQGYFQGDQALEESLDKFCQSDGTNCATGGAGGVTVNTEVKGSIVGGGISYGPKLSLVIPQNGNLNGIGSGIFGFPDTLTECRKTNLWGAATCSGTQDTVGNDGNVQCPTGSSLRITGTYIYNALDNKEVYFYNFICVKN